MSLDSKHAKALNELKQLRKSVERMAEEKLKALEVARIYSKEIVRLRCALAKAKEYVALYTEDCIEEERNSRMAEIESLERK